jgi:hypothetical protein
LAPLTDDSVSVFHPNNSSNQPLHSVDAIATTTSLEHHSSVGVGAGGGALLEPYFGVTLSSSFGASPKAVSLTSPINTQSYSFVRNQTTAHNIDTNTNTGISTSLHNHHLVIPIAGPPSDYPTSPLSDSSLSGMDSPDHFGDSPLPQDLNVHYHNHVTSFGGGMTTQLPTLNGSRTSSGSSQGFAFVTPSSFLTLPSMIANGPPTPSSVFHFLPPSSPFNSAILAASSGGGYASSSPNVSDGNNGNGSFGKSSATLLSSTVALTSSTAIPSIGAGTHAFALSGALPSIIVNGSTTRVTPTSPTSSETLQEECNEFHRRIRDASDASDTVLTRKIAEHLPNTDVHRAVFILRDVLLRIKPNKLKGTIIDITLK